MDVVALDHPLAASALTRLRSVATDRATFRETLHQLSSWVIYEAMRDAPTRAVDVETPLTATVGVELAAPPLIVPVLRAGLGMLDAALGLSPTSLVGFVGAKRNEETFAPEMYLDSLPADLSGCWALIIDPMLATGGSLIDTIERVLCRPAEHAPSRVVVATILSAPEGVDALAAHGRTDLLVTACIDSHLDERMYIVPGLGDAGDRQFGIF